MSREYTQEEVLATATGIRRGLGAAPPNDQIQVKDAFKAIQFASSAGMVAMQRKCVAILTDMRNRAENDTPDEYLKKALYDELSVAISRILTVDITKVVED